MKTTLAIVGALVFAGACEPAGPDVAALCKGLAKDEPQVERLFTQAKVEAAPACECYADVIKTLPKERRETLAMGLSDMIAEKTARNTDMEGVFGLYRDGEIPLDEKPYTTDDLNELGEILENSAESLGETGACPT